MRYGMPLYVRIVLILILNLVVVVFLLAWVLKHYYGLDKNGVVTSTVGKRLEGMARLLVPVLDKTDRDQWGAVLAETGETHGVELAIYQPNGGRHYAGSERDLPNSLRRFLAEQFRPDRSKSTDQSGIEPLSSFGSAGMGASNPAISSGRVEILKIGKFGQPASEMALVHCWLQPGSQEPYDLMLVVWKTDRASQVFFSWRPILIAIIGLLVLSSLLWVPFVYRATRRLVILTRAAESISEGDFEIDVASDRGDELGRLSRSVQHMSGKLDEYVSGQKRFLGDIAHELCSPLVRIRMSLGVLEHQLENEDLGKLETIHEEVEELSQLVNELLDFSKASLRSGQLEMDDVDLAKICLSVINREAPDGGVDAHVPEAILIESREDLLRRALGNILRNALRYAGEFGVIVLVVECEKEQVVIRVDDSGPGLPESWLEKVFEPFARPENARTREGGGNGLGLAIAKTCVNSLGGDISCHNRDEGGLSVVITLPVDHSTDRG